MNSEFRQAIQLFVHNLWAQKQLWELTEEDTEIAAAVPGGFSISWSPEVPGGPRELVTDTLSVGAC